MSDAGKRRKRAVLEEVGLGPSLAITDPARLCELLSGPAEEKGNDQEAQRLRMLAEQMRERGVE